MDHADGRFTVEAELIEARDGKVHLKKVGGAIVIVRRDQLSEADRGYMDSLETARQSPPTALEPPQPSTRLPNRRPAE